MSKKWRVDYNECSHHVPAIWERERVLLFIEAIIEQYDTQRIKELNSDKTEMISSFVFELEKLKDKIGWKTQTKLREGQLTRYYKNLMELKNK